MAAAYGPEFGVDKALYPHAYTVDAAACEEIGEWSVDIVGVDFDGDFSIADSFGSHQADKARQSLGRKHRRCASAYVDG